MDVQPPVDILSHFQGLPDPRGRNRRFRLVDLVVTALFAQLCGADDWAAMAQWARCKAPWLQTFMNYAHGTPSAHTFRRVLSRLDPAAFEACLRRWMEALVQLPPGTLIAIDGKSLRQSFDKGWEKSAMPHMVSMYVAFQEKVLSQIQCVGKGQELSAIKELLGLVDIAGAVVTIDALGCQTEVAEKIVAKQADYVLAVKDNQPTLAGEVGAVMAELRLDCTKGQPAPVDYYEHTEEGHGRKETRRVWASPAVERLSRRSGIRSKWAGLASMVLVERERLNYGDFTGKPSVERCCYISSLPNPSAETMAGYIRGHWGVENKLHWQLDVSFQEDRSRSRKGYGAQNMSRLRRIALNLLKASAVKLGIKNKRLLAGWDHQYLLDLLIGARPATS